MPKGALEMSALVEHAWKNHHPIKWEEVSVVDQGQDRQGAASEGGHSHLTESPFPHRDGGLELPRILDGGIDEHKKQN